MIADRIFLDLQNMSDDSLDDVETDILAIIKKQKKSKKKLN